VAADNGHPDAGAADLQLRQVHDLPTLVLHLHFLAGVALELLAADLGDQVIRDLVGEDLGLVGFPMAQSLNLVHQLHRAAGAGTGNRLIGGGSHGLDGRNGVQGVHRGDGDNGGAVGVGDDAIVPCYVLGVHFGNDEGHLGVKTEGGGIVHEDRAGLDNGGSEALRNVVFGGTQNNVHTLESLVTGLLNGHVLALEF